MPGVPVRATRYIFGTTVLFSHFGVIFIFLFYGLIKSYLDHAEIIQGILSVSPLSAIYVSLFIKYVANNPQIRSEEEGVSLSKLPFLIQFVVVLSFCALLIFIPVYVFSTAAIEIENIKMYTGLVDTVFSAYLGVIFGSLFPKSILGPSSPN